MSTSPPEHDDESRRERVNRELIELLNELRVVLPGVTVLLAFLLAVPFENGWSRAVLVHQIELDDLSEQSFHVTGSYPYG